MQIHTIYLAEEFARRGHEVTIVSFGKVDDFSFLNRDYAVNLKKIDLPPYKLNFFHKCINKLLHIFNFKNTAEKFFSYVSTQEDKNIILQKLKDENITCDLSIGVEKGGLLCSALLHRVDSTPYIYYSLELFNDLECCTKFLSLYYLRKLEPKLHKEACATIIQDKERSKVLYAYNYINPKNELYLPVSVYKTSSRIKSKKEKKICLLFGLPSMNEEEIKQLSNVLPHGYTLLLQYAFLDEYKKIIEKNKIKNIIAKNDELNDAEIENLIESSTVAFANYTCHDKNTQLIAFSSEKTARYFQSGIPLIVKAPNSNYGKLFSTYECGILINDFEQLKHSIQIIENTYSTYRKNAFEAYDNFYNYAENFQKMYSTMCEQGLVNDNTSSVTYLE